MIKHDWAFLLHHEVWQWCQLCGCLKASLHGAIEYFPVRDSEIIGGTVGGGTLTEPPCNPVPLKRCFIPITKWKINRT